jgi:catechol 2,3-dioxygenase-like lactoylglutathione lyase family enzyme
VADPILANGQLHHVAVHTSSFNKAFAFYTKLLCLPVHKAPFQFKERMIAWLDGGGILIELCSLKHGEEPQVYVDQRVGAAHIAFVFNDLDAVLDRLVAHGVRVRKPPFLPPTGDPTQPRVSFIEGPDGEDLELREAPGGER